ncbi:buddy of Hmr 2 [Haematobia irritans]|uniref:buddy of Hmr 2 n=1 Tax=Haematobia irritans TaxID=7368 RepID=UPI003F5084BE
MMGPTETVSNLDGGSTNSVAVTSAAQTSERRCENPDCNVNKLISMVPKRKTTQFISEPMVMEKPMLVNGFTAVFQVDGKSAKLMDIKNPNGDPNATSIYRIVPNSHVHVVNYVVVDTDEAYLKKITDNDPATMQKLLTTQKDSADQMLRKIMNGQDPARAATTTVVSTINPANVNRPTTETHPGSIPLANIGVAPNLGGINRTMVGNQQTSMTIGNVVMQPAGITKPNTHPLQHNVSTAPPNLLSPKQSIQLPVRMHPNLKITAVASGESVGTPIINASAATAGTPHPPFIQPVPLASLQSPSSAVIQQIPKSTVALPINTTIAPPPLVEISDKPTYDKMQEEINDLRRTVAMLAEAQAKNQSQPKTQVQVQHPPGVTRQIIKKPRTSLPK